MSSIIEYGSEVWGYSRYDCCDKIQNRAIRFYLGLHKFTPIVTLNAEMGWDCTRNRRWINMLRYWNRLIKMNEDRLTKKLFLIDKQIAKNNWSEEVKCILVKAGKVDIFENNTICDLNEISQALRHLNEIEMQEIINTKPKLRTYKLLKDHFNVEKYIKMNLPKYQRCLLAQFRVGILPLMIETGRYQNIELENRICSLCDLGEIENEIHFLCECPLYVTQRQELYDLARNKIETFDTNLPSENIFILLMKHMQKGVSKFLKIAYHIRRNNIYNK